MASNKATKTGDTDQAWVNVNNTSPNKRKRRRKRNKNKNSNNNNNKLKTVSTKPKHAAPANAATIYCQWFQEGLCHRGKNCFFIHELDPLSDKNPIQHKQMIKQLLSPNKNKQQQQSNTKIQLKKPTKPQQQTEPFILPSQNKAFQQNINNTNTKYNRYSDFNPNTNNNPIQPPNPYIPPIQQPPAPNIYTMPISQQQPQRNDMNVDRNTNTLNANAMEFVPTMTMNGNYNNNNQQHVGYGYNPYLTAENAHTADPHALSSDFVNNSNGMIQDKVEVDLINNPGTFNEDDYEVWEDEHGEIIVVEKDQLYGDDPYYHDQKILKQYNKQRINDRNNPNQQQRGIRSGGQTYSYGITGNVDYSKNEEEEEKRMNINNNNNMTSNGRDGKQIKTGYASMAAKYEDINGTKGMVESFTPNGDNPDYDPNAKICRFWLNAKCAYDQNCNMAHRFETNSCPHCDKNVGKSPLIQQQHLAECTSKKALDEEMKMSSNMECGICRENIMEKGDKFGLLTGCTHSFCLNCIREWRGVLHQSKEVVRSCPICRQITWFIVPSDRFVTDIKRKEEMIEKYKKRLSEIRCKHFDEDEECPFGTSCFYKHVKKDGTVDEKKLSLRHRINADGETEIMKEMRLSEFLFGPDE